MTDHIISVNDGYSLQPEVKGQMAAELKDPASILGANQKSQALAAVARMISLGAVVRDGILNTTANPFVFSKPSVGLTFNIAAGKAAVQPYLISTPASSPTVEAVTTSRWDMVVAESIDTISGSVTPGFTSDRVRIIRGTNNADPVVPARCIPLYRLRLPTNATTFDAAIVDDLRKYTAVPGGWVLVSGETEAIGLPVGTPVFDTAAGYPKVMTTNGYLQELAPRAILIDRNYGTGIPIVVGGTWVDTVPGIFTVARNSLIKLELQAFGYVDGNGAPTNVAQTIDVSVQLTPTPAGVVTRVTQLNEPERIIQPPVDLNIRFYRKILTYRASAAATVDARIVFANGLGSDRLVFKQMQMFITVYPF